MAGFADVGPELESALNSISTANSYATDVQTVRWGHAMVDEVPAGAQPLIQILEVATDHEDIPSNTTRHVTRLALDCFTAKAPDSDARGLAWALHQDILNCLRINSRMGGYAISTTTEKTSHTYHENGAVGHLRILIAIKWEERLRRS